MTGKELDLSQRRLRGALPPEVPRNVVRKKLKVRVVACNYCTRAKSPGKRHFHLMQNASEMNCATVADYHRSPRKQTKPTRLAPNM